MMEEVPPWELDTPLVRNPRENGGSFYKSFVPSPGNCHVRGGGGRMYIDIQDGLGGSKRIEDGIGNIKDAKGEEVKKR
jgi:hypothetical protein